MQCQTIVQLIVVQQIFLDTIHHQVQEVVFFVKKKRHGQISDLFFRVLRCGDKIDSFEVAKIDVPSQDVDIEKLLAELSRGIEGPGKTTCSYLTDVLLLVIPIQISIFTKMLVLFAIGVFGVPMPAFELLS